jgi:hypothetical protein
MKRLSLAATIGRAMMIASGLAFVALAALAFRQAHATDAGADAPKPVGTYDTVTRQITSNF